MDTLSLSYVVNESGWVNFKITFNKGTEQEETPSKYVCPYILDEYTYPQEEWDSGGEWNDWNEFKYSEFYPFTCSCGIAGCEGIHAGVFVYVTDNTVKWVTEGQSYEFLSKTSYTFDKQDIQVEITRFLGELAMLDQSLKVDRCEFEQEDLTIKWFLNNIYMIGGE